ncbi:unnamed protein product [Nesidiocoris tenuis]|uniref:Reverse transcriptase domain-containing protein n=1 Tax=Nesidiocoris tenuis TaxID=355587 RepID=A0A6H5GEZ0_9HEMI|nr:unnamed protein product [Nesidiocoris tenuis]
MALISINSQPPAPNVFLAPTGMYSTPCWRICRIRLAPAVELEAMERSDREVGLATCRRPITPSSIRRSNRLPSELHRPRPSRTETCGGTRKLELILLVRYWDRFLADNYALGICEIKCFYKKMYLPSPVFRLRPRQLRLPQAKSNAWSGGFFAFVLVPTSSHQTFTGVGGGLGLSILSFPWTTDFYLIMSVNPLWKHSTIDQVHRIVNIIEEALEKKNVCSGIFLDVAQAFDKVWHEGLNHKLKKMLPYQYVELLESYLSRRYFCIKQEDAYSEPRTINAGVPQGSVIGPLLYLLYTCDLPETEENTTATFADDTAILAVGESNEESTQKLNRAISRISSWTAKWRIRLNEAKSVHIDFTNRSIVYTPTFINGVAIPYVNEAKYLGMTLDAKLRWKEHVKKKKTELVLKLRKMYWLIGRQSTMTIGNKLLLYNQVLKPVWSYGAQLWGCTAPTNRQIIQRFQNSVLRCITDAPWYFRNDALHRELNVDSVDQVIKQRASAHLTRLRDHLNEEAVKLLDVEDLTRRLKRTKPHELA